MSPVVYEQEPAEALFVPQEDPLLFYRSICQLSTQHLNQTGKLYLEINEQFGEEVRQLLESCGFTHARIIQDMQGKNRIVTGII